MGESVSGGEIGCVAPGAPAANQWILAVKLSPSFHGKARQINVREGLSTAGRAVALAEGLTFRWAFFKTIELKEIQ
jgi:hypothetical protein